MLFLFSSAHQKTAMTLWPWSQHTLTVINGTEDNNHMIFLKKKTYCSYWLLTFPYQDTWAWPRYSPGSQHTLDRKGTPLYTKTALILRNGASDHYLCNIQGQHMKTKVQQLHHKYTITKFCKTVNSTLQSTHVKWVFIASSVAVLGTEHTNKVFLLYKPKDKMTAQSGTSKIVKHYDLVRLVNLFSFSYTGVAQCKIQSKTSDVDTVPIYTCLRRHLKHVWMLIILK